MDTDEHVSIQRRLPQPVVKQVSDLLKKIGPSVRIRSRVVNKTCHRFPGADPFAIALVAQPRMLSAGPIYFGAADRKD